MYSYKKAKPVWGLSSNEYNQFLGFFTEFNVKEKQNLVFAIAARSYYRLYVNGQMLANGPARAAHHYCRVDEIKLVLSGKIEVAVEVAAFDKPDKYCNDCTMESGLLAVEITDESGEVLSYTGQAGWKYTELTYRCPLIETMSHSRAIAEVYYLDERSFNWRHGQALKWECPIIVEECINFLERRAPYADYHPIPMRTVLHICDIKSEGKEEQMLQTALFFNPEWYAMLPKENRFMESLSKEREVVFTGNYSWDKNGENILRILPGELPAAVTWGLERSELGFIDLQIQACEDCVIDILNSDCLTEAGNVKANTYVTRYFLKPGSYHLTTFEPKLVRYMKVIMRTKGEVKLSVPRILDDTYPEKNFASFECSDGELNRIYDAARRTLRLNTLDIFMDCPQRERGGWLCDSQFTAHGAWQMFGDLRVEKDFIENFMLTDGTKKWHGFFPAVYPGSNRDESYVGIANWSFWLLTELYDYFQRSGDKKFIDDCKGRITLFIEGVLSLRGESGLIENLPHGFVDWSLSNSENCLEPISIPNNCLAVYMLEKMAELYGEEKWLQSANEMRRIINEMDTLPVKGLFGRKGDAAKYEKGELRRQTIQTESGVALELWSGFHKKDSEYIRRFVENMGYSSKKRSDPNIGKSNLFIGLMIRFDELAKLGEIEQLVREWKELYLPELECGTGTFFEHYAEYSGCHGFNAAVGALMTNKVLGLGQPMQSTRTVEINPHPGKLEWASGSASCEDGIIYLRWSADHRRHEMNIMILLPDGWKADIKMPFELSGWNILLNGNIIESNICFINE